jgi:hypothetical protein
VDGPHRLEALALLERLGDPFECTVEAVELVVVELTPAAAVVPEEGGDVLTEFRRVALVVFR